MPSVLPLALRADGIRAHDPRRFETKRPTARRVGPAEERYDRRTAANGQMHRPAVWPDVQIGLVQYPAQFLNRSLANQVHDGVVVAINAFEQRALLRCADENNIAAIDRQQRQEAVQLDWRPLLRS